MLEPMTTETVQDYTREFRLRYGQPVRTTPTLDVEDRVLALDLIREEFKELVEASENNDFVEMVDAWGDLVWVIYSAAHAHGVDLDRVLAEIRSSNLSKLGEDGLPIYREDGKILKGPNFFPPNISGVLETLTEEAENGGNN